MKAFEYARYSSDNQREESVDAQLRAIREYCSKNDIEIIGTYIDEAKTATNDDREDFQRMIADTAKIKVDCIIVHKLDRFARNRYDSAYYKHELKKNGAKVLSVLENLDGSPESVILESVLEGMAEYYSKNLAREVKKGKKENALQAKHNGGTPPLGYDVDAEQNYIVNEKESKTIKLIFDMYLNGYGYNTIVDTLNNEGHRTKKGNLFRKNSIHDILINKKYIGYYTHGLSAEPDENGKRNNHKKDNANAIIIPDAIPAIIDKEVFQMVQERRNSHLKPRMNKKRYYMLTGFLVCGLCGHAYTGNGTRRKNDHVKESIYTCANRSAKCQCKNKSIPQQEIEEYVVNHILTNVFSDEVLKQIIKNLVALYEQEYVGADDEKKNLSKLLTEVNKKIDLLLEAYMEGNVEKHLLKEKSKKLGDLKLLYEKQLRELESKTVIHFSEEMFREYMLKQRSNLINGTEQEKRKVLDTFLHKIFVYPDKFEIKCLVKTIDKMVEINHTVPYQWIKNNRY